MNGSLTREEFCLGARCPKLLWSSRTGGAGESVYTEHRLAAVNNCKAAALFAEQFDGVVYDYDKGSLSEAEGSCFCRPVFDTGRFSCRPDLIRRTSRGNYELYTVRAAAHIRQTCIKDAAYQVFVLARCGVKITRSYSVRINTLYDASDKDSRRFLTDDITAASFGESARCARRAEALMRMLEAPFAPEIRLHTGCMNPTDCAEKHNCFASLPQPSVFDISGLSGQTKFKLYREGVTSFEELKDNSALSRLQHKRIRAALEKSAPIIDKSNIRAFLKTLWYPVCFLDFESYQTPFPAFADMKPFEQTAFQFSLHTLAAPGGECVHESFIVPPDTDPREPAAKRLCELIPADACVVAYNMQFEKMVLASLAARFPAYREKLTAIGENVRDMMTPFRKGYYYHPDQYGSYSLKSVMRAVFGEEDRQGYAHLDGIRNGGQAAAAYALCAAGADGVDADEVMESLEKYCNLDTLSLARLLAMLEKLSDIGENK